MSIDLKKSHKYLKESDFNSLFIEELGWDHYNKELEVPIDSKSYTLSAIAEKKGMVTFLCPSLKKERIPDYSTRRKIEKQIAKYVHEHIIIYTDKEKATHVWQWVKRESGKPAACSEHIYHHNQPGRSTLPQPSLT
ncbi:MAG: SAM-dependent methyltransferase, partial [Candidatus Mariimomonas ferrooxydans]